MNKNKVGRPQKFTTEELKSIIDLYIEKNAFKITKLSATKLAEYSTKDLNKPAHYQDFTRNKDVKNYITVFNEELTKRILNTNNIMDIPIYQKLNIKRFLDKNNSREKLEKNLKLLEDIRKDVHESYAKLYKKYISKDEELHKKESELKKLELEVSHKENSSKETIKKYNEKIKEVELRNKKLREKNRILEEFLNKYHYETIAEYALYFEGIITSGVEITNENIMCIDDYKSGNYDMSDVIKTYSHLAESKEEKYTDKFKEEAVSLDEYLETETKFNTENITYLDEINTDVVEEKERTNNQDKEGESSTNRLQEIENEILKGLFDN